jgi:hypothetical protein
MRASKKSVKAQKSKNSAAKNDTRIDILFSGPLLFVPETANGNITGLEVFAPQNGHHLGGVFLPGVIFTDAELDDPKCERWPVPESFSMLDPHSYSIELTQSFKKPLPPFRVSSIPNTSHKIKPGRRLSPDWDASVAVRGQLSGWSSHRLARVTAGLFHGADAPKVGASVSSLNRLTYTGVTGAEFFGAADEARAYLRDNFAKGGTLILVGEIAYQPSLLHERKAIDAIARLAGLDFHLADTAPMTYQERLMSHVKPCGVSMVVADS